MKQATLENKNYSDDELFEDEDHENQSFLPSHSQPSSPTSTKESRSKRKWLYILICTIIIHSLISYYFDFNRWNDKQKQILFKIQSKSNESHHVNKSNVVFGHLHFPSKSTTEKDNNSIGMIFTVLTFNELNIKPYLFSFSSIY